VIKKCCGYQYETLSEIMSFNKETSCGLEDRPSLFCKNSDFPITTTPNLLSCPINLLFKREKNLVLLRKIKYKPNSEVKNAWSLTFAFPL
jgi:hypothetical protein